MRGIKYLQSRYKWDQKTCLLYRIQAFPHFRGLDYTQTHSGPNKVSTRWPLFRDICRAGFDCIIFCFTLNVDVSCQLRLSYMYMHALQDN